MKMNRIGIVAATALLIAGVTYPILALDSHKNNEPAKAVENKDEGKAPEVKPVEPKVTDAPVVDSVVTETQEVKTIEPMAKDATTTEPVVTETKPAVPSPNSPNGANKVVNDTAKDAVKDKVMETAKDKAADATTSTIPATPDAAAPTVK
jgi:hypothetical protein